MVIDYGSVLMTVAAAGAALCFILAMNWLNQRHSRFLATWAMGMAVLVTASLCFFLFNSGAGQWAGALGGVLLVSGFAIGHGGMEQFRDAVFPFARVFAFVVVASAPIVVAFAAGFGGLGLIFINAISTIILSYSALSYWRMRHESVVPITMIVVLHALLASSFALCVVVGLIEAPLYFLSGSELNWAELVNLVCSVVAITGIGGLFVTIHQERITRQHRVASLTDPLTNLFNRRALFERYETGDVPMGTAIIIFDLDDFKTINDRHGHALGDLVLASFAQVLDENLRFDDMAVRLGGEEFAAILPGTNEAQALGVAERILNQMAQTPQPTEDGVVFCTVSAGVAFAAKGGKSLDTLMRKADNALYLSKRGGRNRVTMPRANAA